MSTMENPKGLVTNVGWGFTGYFTNVKNLQKVPIGVFSQYRDGAASANAWMRSTPNAIRWEAEKLYEEIDGGK
jgi:hypothetical protein